MSFQKGIDYNLFGHFGDCHLHFNFFPNPDQQGFCDSLFDEFYKEIKNINGSPFAEHGIGLFKQKIYKQFYGEIQINMFKSLKRKYDPENKFFSGGLHVDKVIKLMRATVFKSHQRTFDCYLGDQKRSYRRRPKEIF